MTLHDDLRDRVAVITGGGSGIGEGLARHAALNRGMQAFILDVSSERAEAAAAHIRADGGRATALPTDVTDADAVFHAARDVVAHVGAPTLLFANAGVEHTGLAWETEPADWDFVQSVNVTGAFHTQRAFLPAMIDAAISARVIFTSSVGGIAVGASQSAYTVSKHAIRVLAQSVDADLRSVDSDVAVSVLLPGAVSTRIFEDARSTGDAAADEYRATLAAHLRDDGLTPADLASATFAGIDAGRTWIYPHPEQAREYLDVHTRELLAGLSH